MVNMSFLPRVWPSPVLGVMYLDQDGGGGQERRMNKVPYAEKLVLVTRYLGRQTRSSIQVDSRPWSRGSSGSCAKCLTPFSGSSKNEQGCGEGRAAAATDDGAYA